MSLVWSLCAAYITVKPVLSDVQCVCVYISVRITDARCTWLRLLSVYFFGYKSHHFEVQSIILFYMGRRVVYMHVMYQHSATSIDQQTNIVN